MPKDTRLNKADKERLLIKYMADPNYFNKLSGTYDLSRCAAASGMTLNEAMKFVTRMKELELKATSDIEIEEGSKRWMLGEAFKNYNACNNENDRGKWYDRIIDLTGIKEQMDFDEQADKLQKLQEELLAKFSDREKAYIAYEYESLIEYKDDIIQEEDNEQELVGVIEEV
jgi:hypothetical protein